MKVAQDNNNMDRTEQYDIHDVFDGCIINAGLVLCYVLYRYNGYVVNSLDIYTGSDDEVTGSDRYEGGDIPSPFKSFDDFVNVHYDGHFVRFTIHATYEWTQITISGRSNSKVLDVSYSKETELDLLPVIKAVKMEAAELLVSAEPHMGRMTKRGFKYGSNHLKKLQEYEDAEDDGRLLKLPCKPGDTIYGVRGTGKPTGHFGAYPIPVKSLVQIVSYMDKKMFGDKVFIYINQAQEKADQITLRNLQRLSRNRKRQKQKNKEMRL